MRLAAARIFCTAGSNNPINVPMIAMTTRSSTRVKAERRVMAGILRSVINSQTFANSTDLPLDQALRSVKIFLKIAEGLAKAPGKFLAQHLRDAVSHREELADEFLSVRGEHTPVRVLAANVRFDQFPTNHILGGFDPTPNVAIALA